MITAAVKQIREGNAVATQQDETKASFQPVITAEDTIIDWNQPIQRIYNLVRGSNPAPGGITSFHGVTCKIFDAKPSLRTGSPGEVVHIDDTSFTIAAKDGALQVESIQAGSDRKQPAQEFAQKKELALGDKFGM